MSKDLDTDMSTLELIINAFKQKSYEENMITFCKPVYSVSVQDSEQLKKGMSVTGKEYYCLFNISNKFFFILLLRAL